jgi:hypothetical protein
VYRHFALCKKDGNHQDNSEFCKPSLLVMYEETVSLYRPSVKIFELFVLEIFLFFFKVFIFIMCHSFSSWLCNHSTTRSIANDYAWRQWWNAKSQLQFTFFYLIEFYWSPFFMLCSFIKNNNYRFVFCWSMLNEEALIIKIILSFYRKIN